MKKGPVKLIMIFMIGVAVIFGSVMSISAYKDDTNGAASSYSTDKSDRTIIKNIYTDQKEVLRLLKEIKSDMARLRSR